MVARLQAIAVWGAKSVACFLPDATALARISHQVSTAAVDLGILTGVLGPRTLRRSAGLRLGFSALRVRVITPIYTASLRKLVRKAGLRIAIKSAAPSSAAAMGRNPV